MYIPEKSWVIAAGDTDRNYADICLKHNVVIMGPGNHGPVKPNFESYRATQSSRMCTILLRFYEMSVGDLVVLRLGLSEIHGVGYLECLPARLGRSYGHSEFFADIDGWDLQHYHRVRWVWAKPDGKPEVFKKALNFGDTTQMLSRTEKNIEAFKWIEMIEDKGEYAPPFLPFPANKEMEINDATKLLYEYGVGAGAISGINQKIFDLCALANWYKHSSIYPLEAETVAHLVVPLLVALGWTPQRIALEYSVQKSKRADIALFANGNRREYEPIAIIEAKRLNQSCLSASKQVREYAENMKYVRRLIVTDGIRYGIFTRRDGESKFSAHLSSYMNLAELRDCYPVYHDNCGGADEMLLTLSADWSHRFEGLSVK